MNSKKSKLVIFSAAIFILVAMLIPSVEKEILLFAQTLLGKELSYGIWGKEIFKFSLVFIFALFMLLPSFIGIKADYEKKENDIEPQKIFRQDLLFFFLVSGLTLLFCTTTSPLYAFHDYVDSHCFFTVGKFMMQPGKVLYRDIYEQKGPFLYFLHALAYLISNKSYVGVYIIQIISGFFFLLYSYKTLTLFFSEKVKYALPVVWVFIICSTNYVLGDTSEELSFALIAVPFYFSIKNLKLNKEFTPLEMFISGLFAGCIFWMKFSLVGFFVGWAIVPVITYIKNKKIVPLLKCILWLLAGLFAATLPWLIYFGVNHAVMDLIQVYILDNIFLYPAQANRNMFVYKIFFLVLSFGKMVFQNPFIAVLLLFSVLYIFFRKNQWTIQLKIHFVLCYCSAFFFIFIGGVRMTYYSLLLSVFVIFACGIILDAGVMFNKIKDPVKDFLNKNVLAVNGVFVILISLMAFIITPNKSHLGKKLEDFPQYHIAQRIKQKENATLLNYGELDLGVYTLADVIPSERFFCYLNTHNPEMYESLDSCVREGRTDFIVTVKPECIEYILSCGTYKLELKSGPYSLFSKIQ